MQFVCCFHHFHGELHRSLAFSLPRLRFLDGLRRIALFAMMFVQIVAWALLSTLWCSPAMKILVNQEAANAEAVAKCYSGPEQNVWELVMGKQIDIGAASSTLELAQRAHVGPGMKGVELNSNNGGGMRTLVRLAGVDSMIGVELTKSVVETGRKRTEEEHGMRAKQECSKHFRASYRVTCLRKHQGFLGDDLHVGYVGWKKIWNF